MAKPQWPSAEKRRHIGKSIPRLDGPIKSTGVAKYAYDQNPKDLLYAKIFYSPYPLAIVNDIDLSAAEALPGVEAVWRDEGLIGKEVYYVGQVIAAIAATTEEIANEAVRLIKLDATPQPAQIDDKDLSKAEEKKTEREEGDFAAAMDAAEVKSTGFYSIPVITHCCLESHGQTAHMEGDQLNIWPSTLLTQKTGKPVKLMLERDQELMVAGNRPSAHGEIPVGVNKSGKLQAMDAKVWGTGGPGGYRPPPLPYVFTKMPGTRMEGARIKTNRGGRSRPSPGLLYDHGRRGRCGGRHRDGCPRILQDQS